MIDYPARIELSVEETLRLVETGSFGLPDFQRSFAWGHDHVRSLLATVFMGWPAGSILLMEAPPTDFFAIRSLEGLDVVPRDAVRHLILDGQQRVTALAHAFGLASNHRAPAWYLDIDALGPGLASGDIEDAFVRKVGNGPRDAGSRLIPISALRNSETFQNWRGQVSQDSLQTGAANPFSYDELNLVWLSRLERMRSFSFSCTVLPADMPLSAVSVIFEKLNTSGMRLDTFDLVVAHVYKDGRNLRSEWESELKSRPVLGRFLSGDALVAAELIAMTEIGDTRRSGLLNLEPDLLWSKWSKSIDALEAAVDFLTSAAGIANKDQLPHRGLLLALAGVAYELEGLPLKQEHTLLHWLYSRGLSERFNAAVNTRVVEEFRALLRALSGGTLPGVRIDRRTLLTATRRSNGIIALTLQAIIRRGSPSDLPDGLLSTPISPERSSALYIRGDKDQPLPELAFGVLLGGPRTSALLEKRGLRELQRLLGSFDHSQVDGYLAGQYLPSLESRHWASFEKFIAARVNLVLAELKSLERGRDSKEDARGDSFTAAPHVSSLTTMDLLREWLGEVSDSPASDARIQVVKRVAGNLLAEGRAEEAIGALRPLLDGPSAWTVVERAEILMLQSLALEEAGLSEESIDVLDEAIRALPWRGSDPDAAEARIRIAARLGGLLLDDGRPQDGVAVLWDALEFVTRWPGSDRLATLMKLDYARGRLMLGDLNEATEVVRGLLFTVNPDVVNSDPEMSAKLELLRLSLGLLGE